MKHKYVINSELFGGDFSPRDEKRIRRECSVTHPPVFKEENRQFFFIFFFLKLKIFIKFDTYSLVLV
jgi:hypothetical protein